MIRTKLKNKDFGFCFMRKYSFVTEVVGVTLANMGRGAINAVAKNKTSRNMLIGAGVGGVANKIRGGSFMKGAAVGGAVGYGATRLARTNMMQNAASKMGNYAQTAAQKTKSVAQNVTPAAQQPRAKVVRQMRGSQRVVRR